jgi:toxin YoeB
MKDVEFEDVALEQFYEWEKKDKILFNKIVKLIAVCRETPFVGIGKPEPLKHNLKGYWSRRINKEHRLVYKVTPKSIIVISCKFHY